MIECDPLTPATARSEMDEIDTTHTDDPVCPYCGCKQDDYWEVIGNKEDCDMFCDSCGKAFRVSVYTKHAFTTTKAT